MFRWCAYCLRFQGERPPYRNFVATHGICPSCEAAGALDDGSSIARLKPILAFHADLLEAATGLVDAKRLPDVDQVLARGHALGIGPSDLLMGVLQPVLYEVGRLWEAGSLSPAIEARFTSFTESLLDALVLEQRRRGDPLREPPLFVVVAPGNQHVVGARMLAFVLRENGHDARLVTDAVSADWLVHLAALLEPSLIGISIALPNQVSYALDVLAAVEAHALDVRVVLGGFGVEGLDRSLLPPRLELLATLTPTENGPGL